MADWDVVSQQPSASSSPWAVVSQNPSSGTPAANTKAILAQKYPQYFGDQAQPEQPGFWQRFIEGVNPIPTIKRAIGTKEWSDVIDAASAGNYGDAAKKYVAMSLIGPPGRLASDIISSQVDQAKQARDYAKAGRYSEAAGHGLAATVPFFGPQAASIGEDLGGEPVLPPEKQVQQPRPMNPSGALGTGTAMVAQAAAAKYGPQAVDATVDAAKAAAQNVKDFVKTPGNLQIVGGTAGLAGSVPAALSGNPYAVVTGAYAADRLAKGLAKRQAYKTPPPLPPEAPIIPSSLLDDLGMTQSDFEGLPKDGQQQILDLAGRRAAQKPFTPPPPDPNAHVDPGPSVPKGRTLEDLMREDLNAKRAQNAPMPPPGPPAPKQLNAGAIVPPAPADTSGVIAGWKPQILEREPMPPPQAPEPMPPPGSTEPPASFLDQENSGMLHDKLIANRAAKAGRFIDYLGGTQNLPRTQAEWAKVARDMGEEVPSAATQAQIEAGLNKRMVAGTEVPKRVETIPAHLKNNPKALKIAQKLAESMSAPQ